MIQLILGYCATILLAVSLMVNNDLKFRWLNTWGCLAFIVYGIMINALPVILTNSLLLLINSFYLVKIYRTKELFDLLEFEPGVSLIKKFLSFYSADIKTYFPEFSEITAAETIRFVITRDIVIANIFAARLLDDGIADVTINYTVEKYRDYKVGKFIFEKEKNYLLLKGVKQIRYSSGISKKHARFLVVMGFEKVDDGSKVCYVKTLAVN